MSLILELGLSRHNWSTCC